MNSLCGSIFFPLEFDGWLNHKFNIKANEILFFLAEFKNQISTLRCCQIC